jgi:hypothetical protein
MIHTVESERMNSEISLSRSKPSGTTDSGDSGLIDYEESSAAVSIPPHPLGVKPSGNAYTATNNARYAIGPLQILPDEVLAMFLESLDAPLLRLLGVTCKFLYAFTRSEELWKPLFIE